MRFQLTHKLATYLLVLAAMGGLASASLLEPAAAIAALGLGLVSWFLDPGTRAARLLERVALPARLLVAGLVVTCVWRVWRRLPEPDPTPIVRLVVFLTVVKLCHRSANRDYLQIYLLAFLMMLAGGAYAQSFWFVVAFAAYVVLTTWTLILLHLRREMEENYLVKHSGLPASNAGGSPRANAAPSRTGLAPRASVVGVGARAGTTGSGSGRQSARVPDGSRGVTQAPGGAAHPLGAQGQPPVRPSLVTSTSHRVGVARILSSRRVVGASFLAATGGVALLVCVGAALTFALVPRVGTGFAFGGPRARKNLVGFSDEVALGARGLLSSDDDTVALRATVPRLARLPSARARQDQIDRLYWRGTVYDTYERGRWLRSRQESLRSQLDETGGLILVSEPHLLPGPDGSAGALAGADRQQIDIVGVAAPVAFALDRPLAFELPWTRPGAYPELRLLPRWSGEVAFQSQSTDRATEGTLDEARSSSGAHYVAYSRDPFVGAPAPARGRALARIPPYVVAPYLSLPAGLSPRVRQLAETITRGRPGAAAKVAAVTDWLARTHGYSLQLGRRDPARDPIEDFLFDHKSGHCEYFASAAAILLRAAGVPTRYVNGFLGGEWNAIGGHVTVRQNRAHAWVEAYLDDFGWMRVDATPPGRAAGEMGKLGQILDSVELAWGRWILGYDLGHQLDLARAFGRGLGVGGGNRRAAGAGAGTSRRRWPAGRRAGPETPALGQQVIGRLYRRCLERLAAHGHARKPGETPRELAARVSSLAVEGADAFRRLSELYEQARFGCKPVSDHTVAELGKRLGRLGHPVTRSPVTGAA